MKHKMKGRKFNRDKDHRRALFCNLAKSLVKFESISTTLAKAKDLRPILEKLVTYAKNADDESRYVAVYRYLRSFFRNDDEIVKRILEIGKKFKDRPGGYLRIIKTGYRYGDCAPCAVIQFVDYVPKVKVTKKDEDAKSDGLATAGV